MNDCKDLNHNTDIDLLESSVFVVMHVLSGVCRPRRYSGQASLISERRNELFLALFCASSSVPPNCFFVRVTLVRSRLLMRLALSCPGRSALVC